MNRHTLHLLRCSIVSAFVAFIAISATIVQAGEQPNIVLIIADDMNWDDCGAYGHPTIRTPNIDALAKEGMKFETAYLTASSCSPSRSSMITGLYPHNTDAEQLHWPLPGDRSLFTESLRKAGYWTAAAGKWHLGDAVRDRFDLIKEADIRGFQLPSGAKGSEKMIAAAKQASGCEDWMHVLQARPKDKPFFLWLAALDPHRDYAEGIVAKPHQSKDVRVPPYLPDNEKTRHDFTLYYDEIHRLDDYIGQVVAELEKQKVAENTIIIFISDNGRPFPRDKTTMYDGGIRTPMIVVWPEKIKPGSVCKNLVSTIDIAPTLLDLAKAPANSSFEGRSFSRMLIDPTVSIREYAFAEDHWHDYEDHARAVCSKQYKYIRNDYVDLPNTPPADAGRSETFQQMLKLRDAKKLNTHQMACFTKPRAAEELYDLRADPFELNNLANDPKYAQTLQAHRDALKDWSKQTDDKIPAHRTADEFHRETGNTLPARIRPRHSKSQMEAEWQAKQK